MTHGASQAAPRPSGPSTRQQFLATTASNNRILTTASTTASQDFGLSGVPGRNRWRITRYRAVHGCFVPLYGSTLTGEEPRLRSTIPNSHVSKPQTHLRIDRPIPNPCVMPSPSGGKASCTHTDSEGDVLGKSDFTARVRGYRAVSRTRRVPVQEYRRWALA